MNAIGTMPRSAVTHGEPRHGALDRAALVVGQALVAWANRRAAVPTIDHERAALLIAARSEAESLRRDRDSAVSDSHGWIR